MEKVNIHIEWAEKNFTAFCDEIGGVVFSTHEKLDTLLQEFKEAFDFHIESCAEDGDDIPQDIINGNYEFVYDYSTAALLHKYDGTISRVAVARATGINERQIGHYAMGTKHPRPATKQKIREGLHKLGRDLLSV